MRKRELETTFRVCGLSPSLGNLTSVSGMKSAHILKIHDLVLDTKKYYDHGPYIIY